MQATINDPNHGLFSVCGVVLMGRRDWAGDFATKVKIDVSGDGGATWNPAAWRVSPLVHDDWNERQDARVFVSTDINRLFKYLSIIFEQLYLFIYLY